MAGLRDVPDLEYCREGRHFIIYRKAPDALLVVDFVHGARDLAGLLEELSREE